jgi:hypothetical protein
MPTARPPRPANGQRPGEKPTNRKTLVSGLSRSQDAYDRFSAATDLPLTVLALLWLPVLVIPVAVHLSSGVAETFNAIDYFVWALFVVEYLIRLYLAPSRRTFVTHHVIDLAVIALPVLRPVRALRLLRLFRLIRVAAVLANGLRRAREIFWASPLIVEAPFKLPVPGWPRRSRSRRVTSSRRRCDVSGYYRSRRPTIQLFSLPLLSS